MRGLGLLFSLPVFASARVVSRSSQPLSTSPTTFNLAVYNTDGQATGQYLGQSPDPYNVNTAPDGTPIYIGYATSSLPSSDFFQLSEKSWSLNGGTAIAHQYNIFDMIYFADAANAAGLPLIECFFDRKGKLICSTPNIANGQFALCGSNVAFYDGVSSTGCPAPVTNVELYKV